MQKIDAMGDDDKTIDPEYVVPDDVMRRKIRESLDDPRPDRLAKEVFDRLERKHAERMKERNARRPTR
jgi:antitoxin ParD1/3/4